ncbi:STP1 protein [Plasmodium malariae]|uniref:STP1 protein n=2 Tax=Plasmodium (Plasmodium) TaxID=418103 RepID=A0A1A8X247_PLAMA|nr:STP1 protein [Plasmodium malariae]
MENYWIDDNRDEFISSKDKVFGITSTSETWYKDVYKPLIIKIHYFCDHYIFKRVPDRFLKHVRDIIGKIEDFLHVRDNYVDEMDIDCESNDYYIFQGWLYQKEHTLANNKDWHLRQIKFLYHHIFL